MRVVVTGASGDLGQAICLFFEQRGWVPIRGTHQNCDVEDDDAVEQFLGASWPFDGLVCCHGAPGLIRPSLDVEIPDFVRILDIDLVGTFRVCRAAARYLLSAGKGSIVNVSSIHALATYPQRAAYAAAKAGVVGLTRALAVEWASQGVRVNAVLPGQIEMTRRTERVMSPELLARSPSGHLADPLDVATACWYLLGAHGINGQTLVVDDGWLASAWWGKHGTD